MMRVCVCVCVRVCVVVVVVVVGGVGWWGGGGVVGWWGWGGGGGCSMLTCRDYWIRHLVHKITVNTMIEHPYIFLLIMASKHDSPGRVIVLNPNDHVIRRGGGYLLGKSHEVQINKNQKENRLHHGYIQYWALSCHIICDAIICLML